MLGYYDFLNPLFQSDQEKESRIGIILSEVHAGRVVFSAINVCVNGIKNENGDFNEYVPQFCEPPSKEIEPFNSTIQSEHKNPILAHVNVFKMGKHYNSLGKKTADFIFRAARI